MDKKSKQLGIPIGKATHKLKKLILFNLVTNAKLNICYQCKLPIESDKELSIEHKIPYLDSDNPVHLFFDLDNIGFSHLKCNAGAARRKNGIKHPSQESYRRGCHCDECKNIEKLRRRNQRGRGINT